ncbi:MAG: glyoxalase/bleomycin resistance protein/dioxygenase [Myxococcaceae bacterium]|nr:glyoxalase/bleomycin resistance protein/dioxygenase [Myxococcaceae bacterium]
MEINGIAHVILTVSDMARSAAFYRPLLERLGLKSMVDRPDYLYYVGARTALGLRPAAPEQREQRFVQSRVGLHHVCFRARSRDDVDQVHAELLRLHASIVHPPEEATWAPGYYSVLFEDPDGIRLEVNFVPGKGLLAEGAQRLEPSSLA